MYTSLVKCKTTVKLVLMGLGLRTVKNAGSLPQNELQNEGVFHKETRSIREPINSGPMANEGRRGVVHILMENEAADVSRGMA